MSEHIQTLEASGVGGPTLRPYVIGDHGGAVLARWPSPGESMPDHFAVLGLGLVLCLDETVVEPKVKALIRQLHPDRYLRDGETAVAQAQQHTALVNDAWRVLKDFEKRCQYVVDLAGPRPDEAYKPSAAELAETFTRNEELDELSDLPQRHRRALQSMLGELEGERVDVREQLREAAELWDAALSDPAGEVAARKRLRVALGRLSYLDNLRTRCKALLAQTVPERG